MNKLKVMIAAVAVSMATLFTGCTTMSDTTKIMAARAAGNIGVSAWFAIDDPDEKVKTVLKDVVTLIDGASTSIGAGTSYVDALTPITQEIIAKHSELTPAQKNLINTGASVVLGALDSFIAANPELKDNAELASKIIASFCEGCLEAINRSASSSEAIAIKKANTAIKMQYDVKAKAFTAK